MDRIPLLGRFSLTAKHPKLRYLIQMDVSVRGMEPKDACSLRIRAESKDEDEVEVKGKKERKNDTAGEVKAREWRG